ncbi:hypothetical protein [Dyella sp.]|uniref:hypothetical protein n=1 Tax=Dyella sp. TaxID=1869338 RepID=UPI002ED5B7CC
MHPWRATGYVMAMMIPLSAMAADQTRATSAMRLMLLVTSARTTTQFCAERASAYGRQDADAVRRWLDGYGLRDPDAQLQALAGDGYDVMRQALADYGAQYRQRLASSGDPAMLCSRLPEALRQPAMDLAAREPAGLAALGGVARAASAAAAASTVTSSLQAPAGKGIAKSDIQGVYLLKTIATGVGGASWPVYEPYLLLKDGTAYEDPRLAPDSLDVSASRQQEARRWGRWSRAGGDFQVQMPHGDPVVLSDDLFVKPADSSTPLAGSYKHVGGGGSLGVAGGSFMRIDHYQFRADGSYSTDASAGLIGAHKSVDAQTGGGGRYLIDGYAIELTNDQGHAVRLFFYRVGDKLLHIGGADYVPGR